MPNWLFVVVQVRRRLWLTVSLYSVLGVTAALVAARFGAYVPDDFPLKLGSDAVDDILTILASSMLAVTTFSLATLVAAYTSVVATVSPRAAKLLVSTAAIRNPLATFIGAFVYAMVGIIAVHTGYYGAQGRVILFFFTLAVLLLVIVAMLSWIGQLSGLGQTHNVIDRVVEVTREALGAKTTLRSNPERPWKNPPAKAHAVHAARVGYVCNIDLEGLERIAAERNLSISVTALPGVFVHAGEPLMWVTKGTVGDDCAEALRSSVALGDERTHQQDPLYGARVLGEIVARALSPGINDPGTARDVLAKTVVLVDGWGRRQADAPDGEGRVVVRPISAYSLLEEALEPAARHGAGDSRLQADLHTALAALSASEDAEIAEAAVRLSNLALEYSGMALKTEAEKQRVALAANAVS